MNKLMGLNHFQIVLMDKELMMEKKNEENVLSCIGEYDIRWNVGEIISNTE